MEEYFGFGLIGLVLVVVFLGIKKIITRKKDLFEYEDEIILDNDMVHYGPFSGSIKNSCQKLVLLLAISSSYLSAGIELRTIDNWGIDSWSNELIMMEKVSDNTDSSLFIQMNRPFCICTDPVITTPIRKSSYNEGDKIEASMTVDSYRPVDIIFEIQFLLDRGAYVLKPTNYPPFRDAEIIKIKFNKSTKMEDMTFNTKGMSNTMKQSERICLSTYELDPEDIQETNRI
ncbi:MAG: hypothetical protein ACJ0FW_03240 [Gammaproteobacteria bacterium]